MIQEKTQNNDIDEVLMALTHIGILKEMRVFANDLFTESEIMSISSRWKAARMLYAGFSYKKIERLTKMSSATIARIAKKLENHGGGFTMMLKEIEGK